MKSYLQCVESAKSMKKNNSDILARAIHLKPQNMSYPISWLVVVKVFVCHGSTLCSFHSVYFTMLMSINWCHSVNVTMLIYHSWHHSVDVTLLMKIYVVEQHMVRNHQDGYPYINLALFFFFEKIQRPQFFLVQMICWWIPDGEGRGIARDI